MDVKKKKGKMLNQFMWLVLFICNKFFEVFKMFWRIPVICKNNKLVFIIKFRILLKKLRVN